MKKLLTSRLVLALVTFVILASAIVIPLSGKIIPSHAASSFNIVSSPSPGISNQLRGVTSISANDAWVVGWTSSTGSSPYQTLIEHWDGTSWSQQTSPSPGANDNHLLGVKALSATNIWAVGDYRDANQTNVLIEHSTDGGSTWIQDTDSYTGTGSLSAIDGDPSSGDAWAVGSDGSNKALTLHLVNGHFTYQANVNPNSGILLRSVSEHNSNDIWAVGSNFSGTPVTTFTMHYDGSSWTTYSSPNPSSGDNELYGVTTIGPNDAWAVGLTNFLTHWDGTSWSSPISLTVGSYGDLEAIAATSSQDIWAAGGYTDSSGLGHLLVWHSSDSGTTWEQVSVESPSNAINGNDIYFHGMTIDTTTGNIWAVSEYTQLNSQTFEKTLIEEYIASPTPPSITVTPPQGSLGTTITVTGNNWTSGDVVDISLSTSASTLTKAIVAGDGTFSGSFTVPNNAAIGTQFINATDETTGLTAQAAFTVTRRKLFVLLQGLSSQLTIDQILNNQHPTFDDATGIMPYLQGNGYSANTDFLEYSYPVDFPPSTPKAFQQSVLQSIHPYSCFDTFDHSLNQDVRTLDLQIRYYLQQQGHENTDVYLIGDSLGGSIGFGYLALLKTQAWSSLPNGGQLKGVITLDAPVGGIQTGNDLQAIQIAFDTKCGRLTYPPIKALNDLGSVYNTSTTDKPLGGTANMIAVIFPNFSTPTGFDNQQLADEAVGHGMHVLTIGNVMDYGYAMSGCLILNKANKLLKLQDFVSSQFVHDEGVPSGVYGRAIDKALSSICDVNSISLEINHGVVLTNSDVKQGIVSFINGNDPSPLLLPPQSIA